MRSFPVPRRLRLAGLLVLAIAAAATALGGSSVGTQAATYRPLCVQHPQLCVEQIDSWNWHGYQYKSGHDEPSVLFYSNTAGAGNSNEYQVTLPTDPAAPPSQDGTGPTWDFQLRPTFWLGMAMCDDQSAPNPGATCKPDSDKNIHTGTNPNLKTWLGNTPGTAFMEMQFYPPGWGPISCTDANGDQDGKWCAALTIDSDQENSNTGQQNNDACNNLVGPEPVNYAVVTKSGVPVAPARPDTPFAEQAVVTPDTLEFNNGDQLTVDMQDTSAGFQVVIDDLTTGESGSMTASKANGFGHALFQPNATTCKLVNYAFHPMYSTSSPQTRVLWAAHSYNVAASDEIGHFEYCDVITDFACTSSSTETADDDDFPCFAAPVVGPTGTNLGPLQGCVGADEDFDGPSYQDGTWPGSPGAVAGNVTTPFKFTSPLFSPTTKGGKPAGGLNNYSQVAFETDLPRIEGSDSSPNNDCQRHFSNPADPQPGKGCVNPPNGAAFYPIYTTTVGSNGACIWQQGGNKIKGTTNKFGGNSKKEYGGLLLSDYPAPGFTITQRYNNFQNRLNNNPCPAAAPSG
jgi:hypothetical protein